MPSPEFDHRLTASDAAFLYLERRSAPMQIGATAILDGDLTYRDLYNHLAPRVTQIPRFRQRVITTPFNMGHPTWEYDSRFDLDNHLFEYQLDPPGDHQQLRQIVGPIYSQCLSRKKPLWELHLIRGLEGGRTAITSSVHHAMVDGVGGNELVASLYDIELTPVVEASEQPAPTPMPEPQSRMVDAVWDNASTAVDAWANYTSSMLKVLNEWNQADARKARQRLMKVMPKLLQPIRRLPFNRSCSGKRHLVWSEFSFAEFRAIRSQLGVTVNDIVLAVLGGAIGRYAKIHGEQTRNRTMRVMVPVSMRGFGGDGNLGNQVSALPVDVPLGESDPIKRAQAINKNTRLLKESGIAAEFHRMTNLMGGLVPASVQSFWGTQINVTQPVFNMVCTNVPGPQIPLYLAGLPLRSYLGMVPVGHQMGLACQVYTYNQKLEMGFTADVRACPDIERVKDALDASFEEMRLAAGVEPIDFIEIVPRKKSAPVTTSNKPRQKPSPQLAATTGETDHSDSQDHHEDEPQAQTPAMG